MNITNCENCCLKKGRRRKTCEIHMLLIKNKNAHSTKIKSRTAVGLCPVYNRASKKFENIIPCFNNDGKHYTAAFTLPTDEAYYLKNDQKYRIEHEKKISEYCQKTQLWQPKPNVKNKYCNVCKSEYTDYKEVTTEATQHIDADLHHQNIRRNKYNAHIDEMVKEVEKNNKRRSQYELLDRPRKCRVVDIEQVTNQDSSKITPAQFISGLI